MKKYILQKFGGSTLMGKMIVDILTPMCKEEMGASVTAIGSILVFSFSSENSMEELSGELKKNGIGMFFLFEVNREYMRINGDSLIEAFGVGELGIEADLPVDSELLSEEELTQMLNEALENEDFEAAANIRDQIKNRKNEH
jgi:hypothetical protein